MGLIWVNFCHDVNKNLCAHFDSQAKGKEKPAKGQAAKEKPTEDEKDKEQDKEQVSVPRVFLYFIMTTLMH